MKTIHHILSFVIAASYLTAAEPYEVIKPPVQDLPEGFGSEAWRMTVEPGKNDFVLTKFQEFEDVRNPNSEERAKREVTRIIWTAGAPWSEDVIHSVFHKVRTSDSDPMQELSILSCFGQEFRIRKFYRRGGSGYGSKMGIVRRFRFADKEGEEAKWITVVLTLKVIDRATAESIAKGSAIALPATGDGLWSVTVPPTPEQIVEQGGRGDGAKPSN
jgi:hypothetical protein